MAGLLLLLSVLVGGDLGLGLVGVAVHHGALNAQLGLGVALGGATLRGGIARRWPRVPLVPPVRPHGPFWRLAQAAQVLARVLGVSIFGYLWAHAMGPVPVMLRWSVGVLFTLSVLWILWERLAHAARSMTEWPLASQSKPYFSAGLLGLLCLVPFWGEPHTTLSELLAVPNAHHARFNAESVRWLDEPYSGIRTASTTARALVLGTRGTHHSDVYLLHVGFSHEGHPVRLAGVYNLSDTSAVDERNIVTWRRWAAWSVDEGGDDVGSDNGGDSGSRSVELADLRGEPDGVGGEWTWLKRAQRALTNLQSTGQQRGIGRSQLAFNEPTQLRSLSLQVDGLSVHLPDRSIQIELGKIPLPETLGGNASYRAAVTSLPPALVPWLVDRLRAVSWIGNERMQWVKGWAFRASSRLEQLEHVVVGIDPDEEIADQLGATLEGLPVATAGRVPGWPPAPMQPFLKNRLSGEGQWVSIAEDILASSPPGMPSPFVFSFIRTDPARSYVQTSVTLWDPRRVELHIVAGTEEPKSATGELGSGTIPRDPAQLVRLAGAFNGAFQSIHGHFGMMEQGRVQLPPKPYAATITTYPTGEAGFGTWPEGLAIPADVVSLRQNLTPLVANGKYNPYQREWWGGVPEGWTEESRTVRSGICLTSEGYMGYFYSLGIDPKGLARAMLQARCTYGLHLDMNAGHAGFEFYRVAARGGLPELGRPLDRLWEGTGNVDGVPGLEFLSRLMVRKMPLMDFPRYVHVNARDFFYLTHRNLLPGDPLTPLDPSYPEDGQWRVIETANRAWPPALSATQLHLTGGSEPAQPYVVTRVDPKQLQAVSAPEQADFGLVVPSTADGLVVAFNHNRRLEVKTSAATLSHTGCVDQEGMLVVLETSKPTPPEGVALQGLLAHLNCTILLPDAGTIRVILPREGRLEAPAPAPTSAVVWLRHQPLRGAIPLFEDTPIVPPAVWAISHREGLSFARPSRAPAANRPPLNLPMAAPGQAASPQ